MSDKKYILTDLQCRLQNDVVLHRIRAIKKFGNIRPGDYGGWVESEDNLLIERWRNFSPIELYFLMKRR